MKKKRFSQVQIISMTALMLALAGVFTIISKMVSIPFIRYASFSAAPSVIIFTSIFLGPLAGGIVGAGSDLIGLMYYSGPYNPIYTINAALMGILPYCLVSLTSHFHEKLSKPYILYAILIIVLVLLTYLFFGTTYFDNTMLSESSWSKAGLDPLNGFGAFLRQNNGMWFKIAILSIYLIFDIIFCVGMHYLNLHFKKSIADKGDFSSPYEIGFICVIIELLINVFAKSGAMEFYFYVILGKGTKTTYWVFALVLSAMFTPNVLFNTFFSYEFLYLANKQIAPRGRHISSK